MSFEVCVEGWNGSAEIEEMAYDQTLLIEERGGVVDKVTLIIKSSEFFQGFYYMYDPGEPIKAYLVEFSYKGNPVCLQIDGVNVHWKNPIRNGVNEALRRCDALDGAINMNTKRQFKQVK